MILQKLLKVYTSKRAKLLILDFFFSAIPCSNHLFWPFWISESTFCGVSLERSTFGDVFPGSGGDGLSLPENRPRLQFPRKLWGGTGNLYSGSFYPLKKQYVSNQQENLRRKPNNLL